jgi:TolA-binding protein
MQFLFVEGISFGGVMKILIIAMFFSGFCTTLSAETRSDLSHRAAVATDATNQELQDKIKEKKNRIEQLSADEEKNQAEIAQLEKDILQLEQQILANQISELQNQMAANQLNQGSGGGGKSGGGDSGGGSPGGGSPPSQPPQQNEKKDEGDKDSNNEPPPMTPVTTIKNPDSLDPSKVAGQASSAPKLDVLETLGYFKYQPGNPI